MSEYIKREDEISAVREYCRNCRYYDRIKRECEAPDIGTPCAYGELVERIAHIPAADVQEVKQGEWVRVDATKCRCSKCDVITLIAQYPNGDKNYCPMCGRKLTDIANKEEKES